MKVFISYTTRDSFIDREILSYLDQRLGQRWNIYIDILHNDSPDKQERVMREINSADLLLILNSHSIKESKWAMFEKQRALELDLDILKCHVTESSNWKSISNYAESILEGYENKKRANKKIHLIFA